MQKSTSIKSFYFQVFKIHFNPFCTKQLNNVENKSQNTGMKLKIAKLQNAIVKSQKQRTKSQKKKNRGLVTSDHPKRRLGFMFCLKLRHHNPSDDFSPIKQQVFVFFCFIVLRFAFKAFTQTCIYCILSHYFSQYVLCIIQVYIL